MRIENPALGTVLTLGRFRDGGVVISAEDEDELQTIEIVLSPEEVAQVIEFLRSALDRAAEIRALWLKRGEPRGG